MRIRNLLVGSVFTVLFSSAASAQTTGGGGNTGGGGGISGLQTTSGSNFQIQQMQQAQQISGGATTGSSLNSTNAFSQYYANPYYQGRAGSTGQDNPGGFGSALSGGGGTGRAVGTTGLNAGRTGGTGATGGRTGTTGTGLTQVSTTLGGTGGTGGLSGVGGGLGGGLTGGLGGGRTGTTGFGGQGGRAGGLGGLLGGGLGGQQQQQGNAIVQLPRDITYTMTIRMPMPKTTPQQAAATMQTELRGLIDRSTRIANPKGIEIQTDGAVVILRGTVRDEEEAATAEGVIRLTPGVKVVKNELKY